MKFLITYGNQNYQKAKERLILEAHQTQQFDVIKPMDQKIYHHK